MSDFYHLLKHDPVAAMHSVIASRELHRIQSHNSIDPEEFFDCSLCGIYDAQLRRARHTVRELEETQNRRKRR